MTATAPFNFLDAKIAKTWMQDGAAMVDPENVNFKAPMKGTYNPQTRAVDIELDDSAVLTANDAAVLATWRPAVRAAIASNVSLSACSTTQDGLTLHENDLALLFAQTDHTQNGVYVVGAVSTGTAPLTRVSWMSQSSDFSPGMRIPITEGTLYAGAIFEQTTTIAVTPGTTDVAFAVMLGQLSSAHASALSIWRPAVRVVVFSNVPDLSACSTTQDGLTLVAGDLVILISQTTASQNGVYVVGAVSTGTAPLTRVSWMSQSSDLVTGMRIPVGPGGTNSGNATLDLQTTGAMTLGTTALTFGLCAIPGVTGTAPIVVSSTGAKPVISLNPLVNANISASAAIDGTKVSPNFGSQDILTGGTAKAIYFVANPISPKVVAGGFSDVAGGAGGYAAVWFGAAAASPTTTNYSFLGDGASSVVLSGPGGTTIYLCFDGSGSNGVRITPSLLTLFPTTMNFASGGTTSIECAGTPIIQFTDTGLFGFFGNLVAQATRVGQLTVTGPGSHPTAVNDVGSSFSQSAINDNFYALTDKVNKLEKVLSATAGGNGLTQ